MHIGEANLQAGRIVKMGPLEGLNIIELAGVGPGPMGAMVLADLGATVLRIERPGLVNTGLKRERRFNFLLRGRHAIVLDLKRPDAVELVLELVGNADALIEGFRPGVTERLGLGPEACFARNPRLIYGRITGWGQTGPLSQTAGHDLNYIAITGALEAIGRSGSPPSIPLNLIGDMAGGALYLALGILAGVLNARKTGKGQVVDAAMVDGAASLMTMYHGLLAGNQFNLSRGSNVMDSGAHFYETYQCADGRYISVAPVEERFFAVLLGRLGIDSDPIAEQMDWRGGKGRLSSIFRTKTQREWCDILEGTDACFAPVLTLDEAPDHHHLRERQTYVEIDGFRQPAPAPRFSVTTAAIPSGPEPPNAEAALKGWLSTDRVIEILGSDIVVLPDAQKT
jgi:alpha-methylacyl-CoA racemase